MRKIIACPGCGTAAFKGLTIACLTCGTLSSKAIKMNAAEIETVSKNFISAVNAGKKIENYTKEDQEKDIKGLYG